MNVSENVEHKTYQRKLRGHPYKLTTRHYTKQLKRNSINVYDLLRKSCPYWKTYSNCHILQQIYLKHIMLIAEICTPHCTIYYFDVVPKRFGHLMLSNSQHRELSIWKVRSVLFSLTYSSNLEVLYTRCSGREK